MNNELMETILNNALKDIAIMKEEIKELKASKPVKKNWNVNPKKLATEAQIIAVTTGGGQVWDGMTHQDITDQFNDMNKQADESNSENKEPELEPGEDKDLFPDY